MHTHAAKWHYFITCCSVYTIIIVNIPCSDFRAAILSPPSFPSPSFSSPSSLSGDGSWGRAGRRLVSVGDEWIRGVRGLAMCSSSTGSVEMSSISSRGKCSVSWAMVGSLSSLMGGESQNVKSDLQSDISHSDHVHMYTENVTAYIYMYMYI